MDTFLIKAAQLILAFAILVIIHEFGHFLFARIFGVKVEKFYIFFNPWTQLFKWKPKRYYGFLNKKRHFKGANPEDDEKESEGKGKFWGDTEYGIGWLPLGGYCKIAGMIDESMDKEQMIHDFEKIYDRIIPMIKETTSIVNKAIDEGKNVLFEGAQACMLDINYGTYPYVTSSSPTSAGVTTGAGVAPSRIDTVVGVVKAYSTRVGEGPFVTELEDEQGKWIQENGHEYGATTGRPRRCGWLDLVVVKHANMLNGLTDIVLTKIDVLTGLETLKVCVGYEIDGEVLDFVPSDQADVARAKPVYKEFAGWSEDITKVEKKEDLPQACIDYIDFIESFVGVPVSMISVGPDRVNNIYVKPIQ